jgi:hypothetical protein
MRLFKSAVRNNRIPENKEHQIIAGSEAAKVKITSKKKIEVLRSIVTVSIIILLITPGLSSEGNGRLSASEISETANPSTDIWPELLQRTPFPFTLPLPPPKPTVIDGTYTKFETKETPPVPCRRCPDYAPEGGLWKLNLNKGVFRIFHKVTGWKDIGSYIVSGEQFILANDPVCHEVIGVYRWKLEEGKLILDVIEDKCAIGLRATNLTKLPWLSCQPPSLEAAITDHWPKPPGCD